jgi:glycosyltransferase involved in cell wall biosynthesis
MKRSVLIDKITVLLITLDEAPNIERVLQKLKWAKRIVIIDSGSSDGTQEIGTRYPQVEIIQRSFTSFGEQCNFGLAQIRTDWVLSLDADYELSDELIAELHDLNEQNKIGAYAASFVYRVYGHSLRGTIYPPRVVLFRTEGAHYRNQGHAHQVSISGDIQPLQGVIYHDDRKPLSRWLHSQQRYAEIEAAHLSNADPRTLSRIDLIRRAAWPAPILVPLFVLFVKGCILDGRAGWYYALQRALAEIMLALSLLDSRLRKRTINQDQEQSSAHSISGKKK